MKQKNLTIILLIFLIPFLSYSQNYSDALRYSQKFYETNARSLAGGNAFGALGANMVSSSINPAGLGLFMKSQITLTQNFMIQKSNSEYINQNTMDNRVNYNIGNIGINLFYGDNLKNKKKRTGLLSTNFGISMNRTNNFNKNTSFEGVNTTSSILDYYIEDGVKNNAGDSGYYVYRSDLAASSGIIYKDQNGVLFYEDQDTFRNYLQYNKFEEKGRAYDINISLAFNISNEIFLGFNLGIPTVHYSSKRIFDETNLNNNPKDYISSSLYDYFKTTGTGINASFGLIYKPFKYGRFGVSIQSPTYYSMHDEYQTSITGTTKYYNGTYTANSKTGIYDYSMITPFRANLSAAGFFDKYGYISIDYEIVNYSLAKLKDNEFSSEFNDVNAETKELLRTAQNIRIGAESRLGLFALRAGIGFYGSPYRPELQAEASTFTWSLGGGFRSSGFFIDFAYQNSKIKEIYTPYLLEKPINGDSFVPSSENKIKKGCYMITIGYRFN